MGDGGVIAGRNDCSCVFGQYGIVKVKVAP